MIYLKGLSTPNTKPIVRNLTARLDPTPLMTPASQETPGYILKQSSGIFILTNILCHQ